ncbi:MAG: repeat-associated core domain protein, partial [Mucilaginibacter sp.]|nr:repeat-associated core domain protein [Mucilaginibacter sp.]
MSFFKGSKGFTIRIVLLLSVIISNEAFGQTANTNYIRTRIPQIAVTDTALLDTIPVQRQAVSIRYDDALGRTWQLVQQQGSAAQMDIIKPFVYDNMGRSVNTFLPYADQNTTVSTTGAFRASAVSDLINFYSPSSPGAPKIATDASPFAQTVYEASPLGRVNEQGAAGSVFQPGTGHTVRISNGVNSAADGINYYIQSGQSLSNASFNAGVLTKTIVTDENNHRVAVWKDLQGRVVTKTKLDAPNGYYSTDYVYNDLNQLSAILPPSAKKQFTNGGVPQQAYIFHYDSIGRVVERNIPGKGWNYTIYNHSNYPVLLQDSNMRVKNQWMYIKYNGEGRIIQTGIYTNTTVTSRVAMQYLCDTGFPVLWETWQPGIGYTDNAFPQQSVVPGAAPLAVYGTYYYDDYSFTEAAGKPFQTNIYNTVPTMRTMGMLTGVSIYVLGTANQHLVSVNYYDNQNRLIQQLNDNHLGQVDVVNNQYNYVGQLTGSQRITTPIAGSPITIKDRYVYDHLNRLTDTYESLQGGAEIDISHNTYNEIGKKVSKQLYSANYTGQGTPSGTITENTALTSGKTDIAGTSVLLNPGFSFAASPGNSYIAKIGVGAIFTQTEEFRYNIRGWLTNINNGTLTNDGITQTDPNALFGESITYSETSPINATPQYNGNIA